jgi:hypothetical protein
MSMMGSLLAALVIVGAFPLAVAFWARRRSSLAHALVWALLAWLSWAPAVACSANADEMHPARYIALSLTGAAGVAVLGARRPHVFAWDSVVLVLLLVMLLPLAEQLLIGARTSAGLRSAFLFGTIAVGTLNYAPTRLAPAALMVLAACAINLQFLNDDRAILIADGLLIASPWIGWMCWRMRLPRTGFDQLWLDFRDAWGFVWSQRVREQFNAAAQNAGWSGRLDWAGLSKPSDHAEENEKYVTTLRAVLQRFLPID